MPTKKQIQDMCSGKKPLPMKKQEPIVVPDYQGTHKPRYLYDCNWCKYSWCCGPTCQCVLESRTDLPPAPPFRQLEVNRALAAWRKEREGKERKKVSKTMDKLAMVMKQAAIHVEAMSAGLKVLVRAVTVARKFNKDLEALSKGRKP